MTLIRYILVSLLICAGPASAQAPDWNVNTAAYQYTMSVVAFLNIDGRTLVDGGDKVAALAGGEVRGVSSPMYVASAERYLAYLTVFGNTENESIGFRIYDSVNDKVIDIAVTLDFKIDGQFGNVFQAFSIASPPLNNAADIEGFSFVSLLPLSTAIGEDNVDITLEKDQALDDLTPEFALSDGARMYFDRSLVVSGFSSFDFSKPAVYSVLSGDETFLKTWTVSVRHTQGDETGFFSTNVITPNNDGLNDVWVVTDAFKYDHAQFRIFDANGRILFESTGYKNDWDGHYKGARVANGKYYFIVKDPDTGAVITGNILVRY